MTDTVTDTEQQKASFSISEGQKANADRVSGHVFYTNVEARGLGGHGEKRLHMVHLSWVSRAGGIWRVEERKSWKN